MDDASKSRKNTVSKSVSHPYISLEEAVLVSVQIRQKIGAGPFDRLTLAQAMGHESLSGPASRKIASLYQFGLISRDGGSYSQTPLAERILFPVSDADKIKALAESAKSPKIYARLTEQYAGQPLPEMLPNILIHSYKIHSGVAKNVASSFRKTVEFAGLFKGGVLTLTQDLAESGSTSQSEKPLDRQQSNLKDDVEKPSAVANRLIQLPSGIGLLIPEEFDYHFAIGHFAEAIRSLEAAASKLTPSEE